MLLRIPEETRTRENSSDLNGKRNDISSFGVVEANRSSCTTSFISDFYSINCMPERRNRPIYWSLVNVGRDQVDDDRSIGFSRTRACLICAMCEGV